MWLIITIMSLVTLQRVVEFYIAHRNTRKLIERGGFEVGSNHHGFVVALNIVWLAGLWYLVLYQPRIIDWPWIYAYVVLEAARGWIIAALGSSWTTRIIAIPGEPLMDEGPLRFFRQPNYFVVAAEIFILPMAFGLWWYGLIFAVLNAGLLWWRLKAEDDAMKSLRAAPQPPEPAAS